VVAVRDGRVRAAGLVRNWTGKRSQLNATPDTTASPLTSAMTIVTPKVLFDHRVAAMHCVALNYPRFLGIWLSPIDAARIFLAFSPPVPVSISIASPEAGGWTVDLLCPAFVRLSGIPSSSSHYE
jgi:hypothetical protein